MSRQTDWQKRKLEEGLCTICGKKELFKSTRCKECYVKGLLSSRNYYRIKGHKPNTDGKRGRPLINLENL